MILGFGDAATEDLFHGRHTGRVLRYPPDVARMGARKLDMVNSAARLEDLRASPGNRLEALKGSQTGLFSIRINRQFRIVFRWAKENASEVRIEDYH